MQYVNKINYEQNVFGGYPHCRSLSGMGDEREIRGRCLQDGGCDEFETLIADADSVIVLDVRTPLEYNEAHIPHAINIDVKEKTFKTKALELLPKDKTIAVYCRSGRRSADAAGILAGEGYQMVNLDGGILTWLKAQKPIE